jgi:hypothetical protein
LRQPEYWPGKFAERALDFALARQDAAFENVL